MLISAVTVQQFWNSGEHLYTVLCRTKLLWFNPSIHLLTSFDSELFGCNSKEPNTICGHTNTSYVTATTCSITFWLEREIAVNYAEFCLKFPEEKRDLISFPQINSEEFPKLNMYMIDVIIMELWFKSQIEILLQTLQYIPKPKYLQNWA